MAIKIYANESVPVAIVAGLKRRGVETISARDSGNLGLTDEQQLEYAQINQMPIFTHDADFLRLAYEWTQAGQDHWGIIYVHQEKSGIGECIRRLKELADLFGSDALRNHVEFL